MKPQSAPKISPSLDLSSFPTHRAAHSTRRPVPNWGTFSSLPQPCILDISSPTPSTRPKLSVACDAACTTNGGCLVHGDPALQGTRWHLQKELAPHYRQTQSLGLGNSLGTFINPHPSWAEDPWHCSSVQCFVLGRWKSCQTRPFPSPSR